MRSPWHILFYWVLTNCDALFPRLRTGEAASQRQDCVLAPAAGRWESLGPNSGGVTAAPPLFPVGSRRPDKLQGWWGAMWLLEEREAGGKIFFTEHLLCARHRVRLFGVEAPTQNYHYEHGRKGLLYLCLTHEQTKVEKRWGTWPHPSSGSVLDVELKPRSVWFQRTSHTRVGWGRGEQASEMAPSDATSLQLCHSHRLSLPPNMKEASLHVSMFWVALWRDAQGWNGWLHLTDTKIPRPAEGPDSQLGDEFLKTRQVIDLGSRPSPVQPWEFRSPHALIAPLRPVCGSRHTQWGCARCLTQRNCEECAFVWEAATFQLPAMNG